MWRGDDERATFIDPFASDEDAAEAARREARHALQVMEATGEGVLILREDGTCEYANDAAARHLGVPRGYLASADIHHLIHRPTCDARSCPIMRPFVEGLPYTDLLDTFLPDSRPLLVQVQAFPLVVGGVVDSVAVMFSDATALFQRALALEQANERLREIDEHKTDFIYTVSHELRTPLTSIIGYTELALESETLDEARRHLARVERNGQRLLNQVEDLLLVARIEDGRMAPSPVLVDVATAIESSLDTVRAAAEAKGLTVAAAVEPGLGVYVDPQHFDQVLLNLLSNAVKFTPDGGGVRVTAEREAGHALIQVEDTGIGIPASEQERMFTRFYRSSISREQAIPGTGLGLVIVKGIVEANNGMIGLVSEEGTGTVIGFTLPCRPGSTARPG
jgi:signal transduction histidine kinase